MKINTFTLALAGLFLASCSSQVMKNSLNYPETKKVEHTDEYFGTKVADLYRWLEDDRAEDTKDWVQREVAFTQNYLNQIPFREEIRAQLKNIWNYEKISAPFKEGDYTYFYKNDGYKHNLYSTERIKMATPKFSLTRINFQKKELLLCLACLLTKKERLLPTIFLKEEVIGKRLSSSMQLPKKK